MKDELKNGIIISVTVLLIILVVYLTTAFLTGELGNSNIKDAKNEQTNEPNYQEQFTNKIIASKVFDQKEDKYMVIFFSQKDVSESIKNLIINYGETDLKLYKVNTDEAINSFIKSENSNANASSSEELKIKGTTLITIENGKITSFEEDESKIASVLK